MFTTYVLYSEKHDKIYIGYTSNLHQRLISHNELATKGWTIKFRPWKLMYNVYIILKRDHISFEKYTTFYKFL